MAETTKVSPADISPQLDFLWKTHSYMNDYIRVADTKATLVIASASALIGALLSVNAHQRLWPNRFSFCDATLIGTFFGAVSIVAFVALAFAFGLGFFVVYPRLASKPKVAVGEAPHNPGFIYWEEILIHGGANQFWASYSSQSLASLTEYLGKRMYILSSITSKKFRYLSLSMIAFVIGIVATGIVVLHDRI